MKREDNELYGNISFPVNPLAQNLILTKVLMFLQKSNKPYALNSSS